jgi:hypothetical protein
MNQQQFQKVEIGRFVHTIHIGVVCLGVHNAPIISQLRLSEISNPKIFVENATLSTFLSTKNIPVGIFATPYDKNYPREDSQQMF